MGTALTGLEIKDTYDGLVKTTDNGPISGTAKYLSDGLGNDSALALSTTGVGIGTTSSSLFGVTGFGRVLGVVADSGYSAIQIAGATGSGGEIDFGAGSILQGAVASLNGSSLGFYTNPTNSGNFIAERMLITSAGDVGIGTSAPVSKLQVLDGDITVTTVTSFSSFNSSRNIIPSSAGTQIGRLNFSAYSTGTTYVNGAAIQSFTTDAWSASSAPTYLSLQTVADSSTSLVERVRIDSDGLKFNGDTAAANALDDYEEGTFTPTITASGSNPTVTYSAGNTGGIYTKVGNLVTCSFETRWTALSGGSGNVSISGLPFTRRNTTQPDGERCIISSRLNTILGLHILGTVSSNLTIIELEVETSVTANTSLTVADLATTGTAFLRGTVSYFV
jgi:hypothetical protein